MDTRLGTIDIAVPKLRRGTYFPHRLMERRKRCEAALITVVADCYLAVFSTRGMDKLVKTLGIDSLAKSQVSRMATDLDEHVTQLRHRPPLDEAGPLTFVAGDALTMKAGEGGGVVNAVVMVATGINADGRREVLGTQVATAETGTAGNAFFADLVTQVLDGVPLVTSDAHASLVDAIGTNLPASSWQRWLTHYAANLISAPQGPAARRQSDTALPLRPARRCQCPRSVRPTTGLRCRQDPRSGRAPGRSPGRLAGLHRLSQRRMAPDLVQQSQ